MKTILLVEDNNVIREDVAEMLKLADYNVLTAANGKEGIELAKLHCPDLIVSDIMMPKVDGLGLLHMLRHDPKTEAIPVIFLTAKNERTDFRNAMESGADDFITKPFNNDELLKAIGNRFKRLGVIQNSSSDFAGLNDLLSADSTGTLETLIKDREINTYQRKQVIYKEGQTPHFLYYVLRGKVRSYKVHDDGKQLVMGLYAKGDFVGHVALLEEGPYREMAEAIEETELVLIPRKAFEELVHKNISVANKVIKMLAKNVSDHEQNLLGIAYNTLRKKVAGALSNLQHKYQVNKTEPFFIDISRDELASIAGTATESCIRTLGEFKNEKLISIGKDNRIEILNAKKLENLLR